MSQFPDEDSAPRAAATEPSTHRGVFRPRFAAVATALALTSLPTSVKAEPAGGAWRFFLEPPLSHWARPSGGGQNIVLAGASLSWESAGHWLFEGGAGLWRGLETGGWDAQLRIGRSVHLGGPREAGRWQYMLPVTIGARSFTRPATRPSDGYPFTEGILGVIGTSAVEATSWGERFGFTLRLSAAVTLPILSSVPKSPYYADGRSAYVLDAGIAVGLALR